MHGRNGSRDCAARLTETYLCKLPVFVATWLETMETPDSSAPHGENPSAKSDLARRLARYRRRVEAEGRPRSLKLIDRAIEAEDGKARDAS